jgi:hypothetical protein
VAQRFGLGATATYLDRQLKSVFRDWSRLEALPAPMSWCAANQDLLLCSPRRPRHRRRRASSDVVVSISFSLLHKVLGDDSLLSVGDH